MEKPPQSTRTTRPDEWEVEQTWQKADLAGHGIPDPAPTQKESEQKVEVGTVQENYRSLAQTAEEKWEKANPIPGGAEGGWSEMSTHSHSCRKQPGKCEYVTKTTDKGYKGGMSKGFASGFTGKASSQAAQLQGPDVFVWGREVWDSTEEALLGTI